MSASMACPKCGAACTIEHLNARPECDKHIKSLAAIRSRSKRRINSRAGGARPGNKNAAKPKPSADGVFVSSQSTPTTSEVSEARSSLREEMVSIHKTVQDALGGAK